LSTAVDTAIQIIRCCLRDTTSSRVPTTLNPWAGTDSITIAPHQKPWVQSAGSRPDARATRHPSTPAAVTTPAAAPSVRASRRSSRRAGSASIVGSCAHPARRRYRKVIVNSWVAAYISRSDIS
jgi:hypothetical protein